jgi:hypothetical protein
MLANSSVPDICSTWGQDGRREGRAAAEKAGGKDSLPVELSTSNLPQHHRDLSQGAREMGSAVLPDMHGARLWTEACARRS